MEPSATVIAAYETALPNDERVKRKRMFGSPCAFVNRQMFFGTFEETLVARLGTDRVQAFVDTPGMQVFTLSPEKTWDDYIQMDVTVGAEVLAEMATEALAWTEALPPKAKWTGK
ncbi:MAG: hypothetical protein ACJAZO_004404 [Myxococcota bacterium]|jgi:hypothetical protein